MEILIQTKHHMFSFGTKGYRKVTTHDWEAATETFELLMLSQANELKRRGEDLQKKEKAILNEVEGWTLNGPTASQLNRLRVNAEVYLK